uniref:Molybdenum cofactor sulfurase 2-like n=1 Tax=Saccoglossus kowalevskii TaxID=10224 RepID=A0ABM0MT75_SACKO
VKHLQQKIKERQITVDADVDSSNCLATDEDAENLIGRFRGNLIIDGEKAYEEDNWSTLRIGDLLLKSGGPCSRCQMVCINQMTAERSKEPLTTLATYRNRKVPFGIHLFHDREYSGTTWIQIGDAVTPLG